MSFGDRLKDLRQDEQMTQDILSKELNVSRATVGRYETNERFPDKDILTKIADVFNVSTDYLLGRTNLKNYKITSRETFYELYDDIHNYKIIEDKIKSRLVEENIITNEDCIGEKIVENIIQYGIDAAIKIYQLETQLEGNKEL